MRDVQLSKQACKISMLKDSSMIGGGGLIEKSKDRRRRLPMDVA